jgi:uncharacterized membrane protein
MAALDNRQSGVEDPTVESADPFANNVDIIARLEQEALHERSIGERISDEITRWTGNIIFVGVHVALFVFWALVNTGLVPGVTPFDPFPFGILTLIVSAEGVFLAIFILISQNRMSRQADRRAHLALQVSMIAEQELTMLLRMQKRMGEHLGLDAGEVRAEAERLMGETNVETIVEDLEAKLPPP